MSTFAYARVSPKRTAGAQDATTSATATTEAGVNAYVTAMAALVPSEVLAAHAAFLSFTTTQQMTKKTDGTEVPTEITMISDEPTLKLAFYGLIVISIAIFVVSRYKQWDGKFDYIRLAIPPLAFVAWTMLQRTTAFDAVCPPTDFSLGMRTGIAIFMAMLLGLVAGWLQKQPNTLTDGG